LLRILAKHIVKTAENNKAAKNCSLTFTSLHKLLTATQVFLVTEEVVRSPPGVLDHTFKAFSSDTKKTQTKTALLMILRAISVCSHLTQSTQFEALRCATQTTI